MERMWGINRNPVIERVTEDLIEIGLRFADIRHQREEGLISRRQFHFSKEGLKFRRDSIMANFAKELLQADAGGRASYLAWKIIELSEEGRMLRDGLVNSMLEEVGILGS